MSHRSYILLLSFITLHVMLAGAEGEDDSNLTREYKIKAAFLYNFIQFVDWPEDKDGDSSKPIIIGIIGKDPFGDAFKPITNKRIKGRKSLIKRFEGMEKLKENGEQYKSELESMKKCHLLFICSSEKDNLKDIIKPVDGHGVLTVGEMSDMLESGGIINFLVEENKVCFEINLVAARQNKLKIRSQLLRLAKRVVGEKELKEGMD